MPQYLVDLLFAMFAWWFGTGLVLYLNQLPERTYRWSLSAATLVMIASLYGLTQSAEDASSRGALLAFTQALLVWAWMEMSYFTGVLTGPDQSPCPAGAHGWERFRLALRTSIYHEVTVAAVGVLIILMTLDAPNPVGCWTYTTLWLMRWSAKLNLFLGVRNLGEVFLPPHLAHLLGYLRRRPMNALFPFSIALGAALTALCITRVLDADTAFETVGYSMLATLAALALLEHLLMVLPLPAETLWRWSLRSSRPGDSR